MANQCVILQFHTTPPPEGDWIARINTLKINVRHCLERIWLWLICSLFDVIDNIWSFLKTIWAIWLLLLTQVNALFGMIRRWIDQRSQRAAEYPCLIGRLFDALDILKIFGGAGALLAVVENIKPDETTKKQVYAMLICCTFCLTTAHALQVMVPEIAVAALVAGVGFVVAFFMTPIAKLLHISLPLLLLPFYSMLFTPICIELYRLGIRSPNG